MFKIMSLVRPNCIPKIFRCFNHYTQWKKIIWSSTYIWMQQPKHELAHLYDFEHKDTLGWSTDMVHLKVCRSLLQVTKASAAAVEGSAILVPDDYQVSVRPQLGVVYLAWVCSAQYTLIEWKHYIISQWYVANQSMLHKSICKKNIQHNHYKN